MINPNNIAGIPNEINVPRGNEDGQIGRTPRNAPPAAAAREPVTGEATMGSIFEAGTQNARSQLEGGSRTARQPWPGSDIRFVGPNNRYDLDRNLPAVPSQAMLRNHAFAKLAFAEVYGLNATPGNRTVSPERSRLGYEAPLTRHYLKFRQSEFEKHVFRHLNTISSAGASRTRDQLLADTKSISNRVYGAHLMHTAQHAPPNGPIVGNCGDVTYMGFASIAAQPENPSVEHATLLPAADAPSDAGKPDHAFLLIGRDANSDAHDFSTWNDDTIVLDIHSREIYPKSMLKEKMDQIPRFSAWSTNVSVKARFEENTASKLPVRLENIPTDQGDVFRFMVNHGIIGSQR